MPNMTDLGDILRGAGLPVAEIGGWRSRGHGAMGQVLGVLCHHTAGAATGNYPSQNIVVNGRAGLAGPLANLGLARDGTWIVIAAGQAWHAGTGSISWCGTNNGNAHLIGIEAESVGTRDDWTSAQRANYPRGVAAILRAFGLGSYRAIGHKEWAPSRKIDPAFWDMNAFRADVARWMTNPTTEDIMATIDDLRAVLREFNPASKDDLSWARDQICAGIGVDPTAAPPVLTPEQIEERAVARRVDVGFARDQILTAVAEVASDLDGIDVDGLVAKVNTALDGVEVHLTVDTGHTGS